MITKEPCFKKTEDMMEKLRELAKEVLRMEKEAEEAAEIALEHLANANELQYSYKHDEYVELYAEAAGIRRVLDTIDKSLMEQAKEEEREEEFENSL